MQRGSKSRMILLTGITLGIAISGTAQSDPLSGPQVMAKCQKAYSALKSYEGTSQVTINSHRAGKQNTYHTSATIRFTRPGKIRVEGISMFGDRFGYVSNGKDAMRTDPVAIARQSLKSPKGNTSSANGLSVMSAVATTSGISMGAGTTIPSLLLKMPWGNPFVLSYQPEPKVENETINGRPVYKVNLTDTMGHATLWVDAKTFLMVKLYEYRDLSKMAATGPASAPRQRGSMEYTHLFRTIKRNAAIPASQFAINPKQRPDHAM